MIATYCNIFCGSNAERKLNEDLLTQDSKDAGFKDAKLSFKINFTYQYSQILLFDICERKKQGGYH